MFTTSIKVEVHTKDINFKFDFFVKVVARDIAHAKRLESGLMPLSELTYIYSYIHTCISFVYENSELPQVVGFPTT